MMEMRDKKNVWIILYGVTYAAIIYIGFASHTKTITNIILVGLIFEISGLLIVAISTYFLEKYGKPETSISPPKNLVKNGMYKLSRHPIYEGMLYLAIGIFIINTYFYVFIILIFNILLMIQTINDEEKNLLRRFGENYQLYIDKTPKFFLLYGLIIVLIKNTESD